LAVVAAVALLKALAMLVQVVAVPVG